MFGSNIVSGSFIHNAAFFFLAILIWNALGRYLQLIRVDPLQETPGWSRTLAGIVQVSFMSIVLFIILAVLISGASSNPTDFRYVSF